MRAGLAWIVGWTVAWAIVSAAMGTDRFYPNTSATSPDGRFRVDAKSPDNPEHGRGKAFASSFVYTLTDTRAGTKVVWTRSQPMLRSKGSRRAYPDEGSPMSVYVDDTGLVAAYVSGESMVFMRSTDGRKIGEVDILKSFPEQIRDQHVRWSTAGPMWTWNSLWSFVLTPASGENAERLLFVIRPGWGHRLVMDPEKGQLIDVGNFASCLSEDELAAASADKAHVMRAVLSSERASCVKVLEGVAEHKNPSGSLLARQRNQRHYQAATAACVVGQLHAVGAVAPLRTIEAAIVDELSDKGADRDESMLHLLREVRMALRRLGETPLAGFGIELQLMKKEQTWATVDPNAPRLKLWVSLEERAMNAAKIEAGMSLTALTELMGCPDTRADDERWSCYDYDIDGENAHTLRVRINESTNTVEDVRRITPPVWKDPRARNGAW